MIRQELAKLVGLPIINVLTHPALEAKKVESKVPKLATKTKVEEPKVKIKPTVVVNTDVLSDSYKFVLRFLNGCPHIFTQGASLHKLDFVDLHNRSANWLQLEITKPEQVDKYLEIVKANGSISGKDAQYLEQFKSVIGTNRAGAGLSAKFPSIYDSVNFLRRDKETGQYRFAPVPVVETTASGTKFYILTASKKANCDSYIALFDAIGKVSYVHSEEGSQVFMSTTFSDIRASVMAMLDAGVKISDIDEFKANWKALRTAVLDS